MNDVKSILIDNINKPIQHTTFIDNTELSETNKLLLMDDDSFINNNDSIFKEPQDLSKSINERALIFFKDIIGHDEIKILLYRALLRDNYNISTLLIGASGTAKTLFCNIIEQKCNDVLYYDASSGSTSAGLIEMLDRYRNVKILIIDELSELRAKNFETFRGLTNDGRISKSLKQKLLDFKIKNLKIFATTNNPKHFSVPFKRRFMIYEIKPYSDDEFIKVLNFCLINKGIVKSKELANELSHAMLKFGIKNVGKAIVMCSHIHEGDSIPTIRETIKAYIRNDGSDCTTNYNEVEE